MAPIVWGVLKESRRELKIKKSKRLVSPREVMPGCNVCFVNDIAARHKLNRVAKISFWSSTKYEYANWEATLETDPPRGRR
jgi:hypothetical protein